MRILCVLALAQLTHLGVSYAQENGSGTSSRLADRKEVVRSFRDLMLERGPQTDKKTGLKYFSGYKLKTLYDVDLYFEAMMLHYMGIEGYAENGIHLFLGVQRFDGSIPRLMNREIPAWSDYETLEHCKPFLAQTAVLISEYRGDYSWISPQMFLRLRRYVNYWLDDNDRDGNGLSEWNSAPHAGADNQFERVGGWEANFCEGVDLNCYLYRECLALAKIADQVGQPKQGIDLRDAAAVRRAAVQTLWDEEDEFFYDRHRRTGEPIKVKYVMSFMTLWSEVATPQQATASVQRYLINPDEFWTPWPVATYAQTDPKFSQFKLKGDYGACNFRGSVWIPYNYLIMHGLRKYGFHDAAQQLADKSYAMWTMTDERREWFNSETGEGYGNRPFLGFSGMAGFMSVELKHGCDPTALDDTRLRQKMDKVRADVGTLGNSSK